MRVAKNNELKKLEMNMTPMIDVCFQLIIFFMLSMRLFSPEGDFSIKMPLAAPREGMPDETQTPPVKVRIRADKHGDLADIQMGQRAVTSFKDLQRQVREIVAMDRGPASTTTDAEVELDCDYDLKYENVVGALTAIAGYTSDDKKTIVRMIERIKFAPMRKPRK